MNLLLYPQFHKCKAARQLLCKYDNSDEWEQRPCASALTLMKKPGVTDPGDGTSDPISGYINLPLYMTSGSPATSEEEKGASDHDGTDASPDGYIDCFPV